jgi:hypothetical protein
MSPHLLNVIWLALMVATGLTWFIGKSGQMGTIAVIVIMLIAALKGWMIVYDFMALRRVKFLWRALVLGWLLLTLTIILLAYWLGLK